MKNWIAAVLGAAPGDPKDQEAAQQILSVVQRVLGEDDPNPARSDAAPRPVSGEDNDEEAKEAEKAEKAEVPTTLPPK